MDEDRGASLVIPGCRVEDWIGFGPQGHLIVDKISTPASMKDSDPFYIEIYKDQNRQLMMAKMDGGKEISFSQLKPGETGDF